VHDGRQSTACHDESRQSTTAGKAGLAYGLVKCSHGRQLGAVLLQRRLWPTRLHIHSYAKKKNPSRTSCVECNGLGTPLCKPAVLCCMLIRAQLPLSVRGVRGGIRHGAARVCKRAWRCGGGLAVVVVRGTDTGGLAAAAADERSCFMTTFRSAPVILRIIELCIHQEKLIQFSLSTYGDEEAFANTLASSAG
jgi:hypothetical protein